MKLLLCDNMEELSMLNKYLDGNVGNEFVVGTTRGSFYLQCRKEYPQLICELLEYDKGNKTEFITTQLKKINSAMGEDVWKKYLFEVHYSIEGSGIPQEVADIVYHTEACVSFYEKYLFDDIYILCNKNNYLLTEIFREIAKQRHISIKVIYDKVLNINDIKDRIFISSSKMTKTLKYIFYYMKLFGKFIRLFGSVWRCRKYRKQPVRYFELGRICFSDAIKHYNWGLGKINAYREQLDLNIICAGTEPETKERFLNAGFNATQFEESYLDFRYIVNEVWLYFRWMKKLTKRVANIQMAFSQLDVSNVVYHRMRQHLLLTVSDAIIIDCRAEGFFNRNKYKIMEGGMGGNNIYTRVFYYHTRQEQTLFFRESNYDAAPLEPIYREEVESNVISLRFLCGRSGRKTYEFYRKSGWRGEAVLLQSPVGKVKAQRKARVRENPLILWAPSYPLEGICTYNKWYEQNVKIIEGLMKIEQIHLLIKYHINQDEYSINTLKEKYESDRVVFVDKRQAIEKYIEEADIVITNPSTVIYDAMLMNRITIAIINSIQVPLKKELDFITCMDEEETIKLLIGLIENERMWENRLDQQSLFVNDFLDFEADDVNVIMTKTLCEKLGK